MCLSTSTLKLTEQKVYTCYMHAVEDRLPEVSGCHKWNWQDTAEVCCYFNPRADGEGSS